MDVKADYFNYLCGFINDGVHNGRRYYKLLNKLHNINFRFCIPMDENRASDGIDMRYRFGLDNMYEQPVVASELDYKKCSVLEMMVALAVRVEESFLYDGYFDHTEEFFFKMLRNLGLIYQFDENYDDIYVTNSINKFLDRDYCSNGLGSLFVIDGYGDIRIVDIWTAMNWYVDENY